VNDSLLAELLAARQSRIACALVTIVETRGSVPRASGSKMLVYSDGKVSGTIGGGKFESLVATEARKQISEKRPALKTYSLHEFSPESFGAICGGESTVFIEPQVLNEAIYLIGAGHCALAIGKLAVECGLSVTVVDDRSECLESFPPQVLVISDVPAAEFIRNRCWQGDEALVLVSRNHDLDREALQAAVAFEEIGYLGMIGSARKVQQVFERLMKAGTTEEMLKKVYAPIGLDINADAPAEIAVSVMAEILAVLRKRDAKHLRLRLARHKGAAE
jgi:xanthine dehydrogenase accessory factor